MTEEKTPQGSEGDSGSNATPDQKQQSGPSIDVDGLARAAAEAAAESATKAAEQRVKAAEDKLKAIGQTLLGQEQLTPQQKLLKEIVTDPIKTLSAVKEITKREVRQEYEEIERGKETQRRVHSKYADEYPEINKGQKLALVEKLAEQHQINGASYEEALDKAYQETIKDYGLTSVSEAQRQSAFSRVGLPLGGGIGPGAQEHDERKSVDDFMSGMKNRHSAVRHKKT